MSIAKQIQDFPDYYVSSAGNVWRKHRNDFFMKLRPNKQGLVKLYTNREHKDMYVHRLVAQAFVPVPEKYHGIPIDELDVHHANFNHFENRASNLMWLTKAEHQQLHSESDVTKQRKSKPKSDEHKQSISAALKGRQKPEGSGNPPKQVAQFTKNGDLVASYASTMEAERQTGVNHRDISSCCNGKLKSTGGYVWQYFS